MNQTQILKKLSEKQRLEQAFSLSDLTRELAIKNIKSQNPRLTKVQIREKLRNRLFHT